MSPTPTISTKASAGAGYVHFSEKLTAGLNDITRVIQENKQTLDTIQEVGIELTNTVATLSSAAIKYVRMIDQFLDTVVPIIEKVPFLDAKIINAAKNAQNLAQSILDNSTNAQKVAEDMRISLATADVSRLQRYSGDLRNLAKTLQGVAEKIK